MQKFKIKTAIVAFLTFILMMTIVVSFINFSSAAEDINGNRVEFPVPAWKFTGPGGWWTQADTKFVYNLTNSGFNPYSTVPQTSHVLWATQAQPGGVIGGKNKDSGIYESYHFLYGSGDALVYGNQLFYITPYTTSGTNMSITSVNTETGEKMWTSDPIPGFTWAMFTIQMSLKFSSNGGEFAIVVPIGNNLYFIDSGTGHIGRTYTFPRPIGFICAGWNDTLGVDRPSYGLSANEYYMYGAQAVANRETRVYCYKFIAFDTSLLATPQLMWETTVQGDTLFSPQLVDNMIISGDEMDEVAYALDRFTGKRLWEVSMTAYPTGSVGYGKYFIGKDDQYLYAYDINSGALAWKSEIPLNSFFNQHGHCVGEGLVVSNGFDGRTIAFDVDTGKVVWRYYVGDCPYEPYKSWYGTWPYNQMVIGGIGAFVSQTGDHIGHNPAVPGEKLTVWESQTGKVRWTWPSVVSAHNAYASIANGMLFVHDMYTGQLLGFGKGPSAVTLSVDSPRIAKGGYAWITGTVTDQSPGQVGTPCVSTADMQGWMEYLHAGMPSVQDKTGVTLTLYAQGSDGSTITIGDVTTNGDTGAFATQWVPPAEGSYTITGVFLGDDSYWTSNGSTSLVVGAEQSTSTSSSNTTTATASIAIAAIAIGIGAIASKKLKVLNSNKEETAQ